MTYSPAIERVWHPLLEGLQQRFHRPLRTGLRASAGLVLALGVMAFASLPLGAEQPAQAPLDTALQPAAPATLMPGADEPAFAEAIARWLDDDEEPALTALAELAQTGNIAARILLAVIDKTPALQGPWLAYLPRERRIALLRAPGGLSGQSWLHQAGESELARHWLALMSVETGPAVIGAFSRLGEARAAREALVVLAAREHSALRDLPPETVDDELLYLLWRSADDARREAILAQVPPGHPQRALMGEPQDEAGFLAWLQQAPLAAPLRAICTPQCGETAPPSCLMAAYGALASHNALATLGSPIEALIPQAVFLDSPRGRATVMRRILQSTDARGRRAMLNTLQEQDACLAETLQAESTRYRYHRPGTEPDLPQDTPEPAPENAPPGD